MGGALFAQSPETAKVSQCRPVFRVFLRVRSSCFLDSRVVPNKSIALKGTRPLLEASESRLVRSPSVEAHEAGVEERLRALPALILEPGARCKKRTVPFSCGRKRGSKNSWLTLEGEQKNKINWQSSGDFPPQKAKCRMSPSNNHVMRFEPWF